MPDPLIALFALIAIIAIFTWRDASKRAKQLTAELGTQREENRRLAEKMEDAEKTLSRHLREHPALIRREKVTLLRELIAVDDHLQLALTHGQSSDAATLYQGLELCVREVDRCWQRCGVTRVRPSCGDPFDPKETHEALLSRPGEVPEACVESSLRDGFRFDGHLLRPAQVSVLVPINKPTPEESPKNPSQEDTPIPKTTPEEVPETTPEEVPETTPKTTPEEVPETIPKEAPDLKVPPAKKAPTPA